MFLFKFSSKSKEGYIRNLKEKALNCGAIVKTKRCHYGEVKRLSSTIKYKLRYLRKSMSQMTLWPILYLLMKWDLITNEIPSKEVKHARIDAITVNDERDNTEEDVE
ncbi:hypothetical protein PHMEG_00010345 [Phytophthora megakarya]|uniref:Uncharacterized protein n=1 Tax=Phytophthora megakarya TaxID=4795 RepID=A0A225WEX4_9STRA|nr:hypothetical protein PHMEG_00010345 [Phytophthora megakarya]